MKNEIIDVTTPICDFVGQYQKLDTVRFHMPGHKGVNKLGMEAMDITEIKGADALYEAEGIIAISEANATRIFGSAKTVYSTEGSSQCIKAMVHLAAGLKQDGKSGRASILAVRNVHKAFIYGAALADFDVVWLYGDSRSICECQLSKEELNDKLLAMKSENELPVAVYVTSPDYLGNIQDIRGLAEVCHKYGVLLMVDNAHGAYLHFVGDGYHPIDIGADICCDSGHKTLPVLTGGAYLHISNNAIAKDYFMENVKNVMAIYGSTSPSYLIMQSLDMCNKYLVSGYREKLARCIETLNDMRARLGQYVVNSDDPLKITLHVPGVTGENLADILRGLGGECEFADKDYMVLMFTPDSDMNKLGLVYDAIERAEEKVNYSAEMINRKIDMSNHKAVMTIREAVFASSERMDAAKAEGRICAAPVVACPPAIPIVISGEIITQSDIQLFRNYGIEKVDVVK